MSRVMFRGSGDTPASYQQEVQGIFEETGSEACSPELAYQMIYEAIDYAAKFGFTPHKDFELAQYLLVPRGEFHAPYTLQFGQKEKKGKPLYVAGPRDNVAEILQQLERAAGPGKYDYVVMTPPDMFF